MKKISSSSTMKCLGMKKITIVLVWSFLLLSCIVKAQDPPQYGTPFTGVPEITDVNMYQAHIRPYSTAGNLAGVIARLDAIKDLGVNVVYVMPIYPHGTDSRSTTSPYCIKDFKGVASEYGSLTDMRNLVDGAHNRGMAVILDVAINGTSWDHPWITQHSDWYVQNTSGVIQQLSSYSDVAALNFNNSDMRAGVVDALRYWVFAANIDGFRFDFADNPPLEFWTNTINNLRSITTHKLIMFAEGDRQTNFQAGFDMNFGNDFYYGKLINIRNGGSVLTNLNATNAYEYLYATGDQQVVRFTSNHDLQGTTSPIATFNNHNGVVANFMVAGYMRGVPMLASGQEVDFNGTIPWPYQSVKINWNANPGAASDFSKVLKFRTSSDAIRRGTTTHFSNANVCAFTKVYGVEKVVVMINMRNATSTFTIPSAFAGSYQNGFTGFNTTLTTGATQSLAAYQYIVLTTANVPVTPLTGVTVSPTSVNIVTGLTQQLTATFTPSDATNKTVTYTSGNTAVATVNANGLVTAVATGTANITVTTQEGNFTAVSIITVTPAPPVSGVTVSPASASLKLGLRQQLTATVTPTNATNKAVTWSSSNTAVATVSSAGLVTSVGLGTANITVTTQDGGFTAVSAITVIPATTYTVRFYRPATWTTNIRIYWWGALPSGALADGSWPGVAMTNEGNGWYRYTFTNLNSTNLIFNDGTGTGGGHQTADLSRSADGWYYNNAWYNSNPRIPTIVVTPYNDTYNGVAHIATGTAKGVGGVTLAGLNLSGTTHTNAGTYNGDAWIFTDVTGNYDNASGTVNNAIAKANATIEVIAYNGTYDGTAYTATGTAEGVLGETLAGLDLIGTTHSNAGSYNGDVWTFTDVTGNYNDASGTVDDAIGKADASVSVTGGTFTYNGSMYAVNGFAYGIGGMDDVLAPGPTFSYVGAGTTTYGPTSTAPIHAGTYEVTASFAGNSNYNRSSNTATIIINNIPIVASVSAGTINCNGGTTILTVTATGGDGALQYKLNNGGYQTGNTFIVNAANSPYTVTVKDEDEFSVTLNSVSVTQPTLLVANVTNSNPQLYYGYSLDQTTVIKGTPTGGVAPYTVKITMDRQIICNAVTSAGDEIWTSSANGSSSYNVCPASGSTASPNPPVSTAYNVAAGGSYSVTATLMANAVFTVTVIDANGCSISQMASVKSEDVRCFTGNSGNAKVKICHKTGIAGDACHELCVDESAVAAHLAHGDFRGNCSANCIAPQTYTSSSATQSVIENRLTVNNLTLKAMPNPSATYFTLTIKSPKLDKVKMTVTDLLGRVVEINPNILPNGTIQIGSRYLAGTYIVEIAQGKEKQVMKLLKMR